MQQPSDEYKQSRLYRNRYLSGKRQPPKQCPILKKDGTRCKNNCVIGYNVCMSHGGRAAKATIKHGNYSKLIQHYDMLKFNSLTKKEKEQLAAETYDKDELLLSNLYLSHLQINRLLEIQSQLLADKNKARKELKDLQDNGAGFKEQEVLVKHIDGLNREINNTAKIIQTHQNNWNLTLKTKKDLREKAESDELLSELQAMLGTEPELILAALNRQYLKANPDKTLDEIIALPSADYEEEVDILFEESEDD